MRAISYRFSADSGRGLAQVPPTRGRLSGGPAGLRSVRSIGPGRAKSDGRGSREVRSTVVWGLMPVSGRSAGLRRILRSAQGALTLRCGGAS